MTSDEQLALWVQGKSVHNEEIDECCPDFSCCNDKMNTPLEEREHFLQVSVDAKRTGDDTEVSRMLMMFLGRALATIEANVYISGPQRETS